MLAFLFSRLRDPRGGQGRRYPLTPLLHRAVLATLAGCDGVRSMSRWCTQHHEDLNTLTGTRWERAPDGSTWRLLLHAMGKTDFEPALGTISSTAGAVIHVDGKALRGSVKGNSPMAFMTSLFRGVDGVALECVFHGKGHEAKAAREAIDRLSTTGNLKGVWMTFDALHTQKNS